MEAQIHRIMKKRIIFCKNCGKKREIHSNNYRQVTLCVECQYEKKSKYNSQYIKEWRAKKRLKKQEQEKLEEKIKRSKIWKKAKSI